MKIFAASFAFAIAISCSISAFAARPVARWDVIPDQRFEGVFEAGVVAFHKEGVKVEFSVNGKPVATVVNPALNPRVKVWEHFVALKASDYKDGKITLQARAVSLSKTAPESYELPELSLYANSKKSLSVAKIIWADSASGNDSNAGTEAKPMQSLGAAIRACPDGGTVNLKAGAYSVDGIRAQGRAFWTTIQPAPGVAREQVEIEGGRPSSDFLRFKDVVIFIDHEGGYRTILVGDGNSPTRVVWIDNCVMTNKKGRWAGDTSPFGNGYPAYVTDGVMRDLNNGGGMLARGLRIEKLGSDAWSGGGKLVVNCAVDDIDAGSTGAHPDFHQSYAPAPNWVEDVILYNVRGYRGKCQGLFGVRLRNAAFVNVEFQKLEGPYYSQYSEPMENVLFLHSTIIDQSWLWRDSYRPTDVVFMNNLVLNMGQMNGADTDPSRLFVSNNHFVDAARTWGESHSSGDPLFRDPSKDDYRVREDSPAASGAAPLQCVPADIDGVPHNPAKPRAKGAHVSPTSDPRLSQTTGIVK